MIVSENDKHVPLANLNGLVDITSRLTIFASDGTNQLTQTFIRHLSPALPINSTLRCTYGYRLHLYWPHSSVLDFDISFDDQYFYRLRNEHSTSIYFDDINTLCNFRFALIKVRFSNDTNMENWSTTKVFFNFNHRFADITASLVSSEKPLLTGICFVPLILFSCVYLFIYMFI